MKGIPLPYYTLWIFALILVVLAITGLFPSNLTIGIAVMLSSVLIVFQVILILQDPDAELPE